MLIVLSPAKTLDFSSLTRARLASLAPTLPDFREAAQGLVTGLRHFQPSQLEALMNISPELAQLNHDRFQGWQPEFPRAACKPAVLAFNGDVYEGLDAKTLSNAQLKWANQHVRILSGLYGLLRPLDDIQPYRLEMGTRFATPGAKDLYRYWGARLGAAIKTVIDGQKGPLKSRIVLNLASEEYFKAVDPEALDYPVVTPVFLDRAAGGQGELKVISFFAKRARGLMTRYVIEHRVKSPDALKAFAQEGYRFDPGRSENRTLVFVRDQLTVPR